MQKLITQSFAEKINWARSWCFFYRSRSRRVLSTKDMRRNPCQKPGTDSYSAVNQGSSKQLYRMYVYRYTSINYFFGTQTASMILDFPFSSQNDEWFDHFLTSLFCNLIDIILKINTTPTLCISKISHIY